MDIHRMQELMRIYDEKLNTPDPPHVFEARFASLTADWIMSLDGSDRADIFEYIGYILCRPEETPKKQRTRMMLEMLPQSLFDISSPAPDPHTPRCQTDSYKESEKWIK